MSGKYYYSVSNILINLLLKSIIQDLMLYKSILQNPHFPLIVLWNILINMQSITQDPHVPWIVLCSMPMHQA